MPPLVQTQHCGSDVPLPSLRSCIPGRRPCCPPGAASICPTAGSGRPGWSSHTVDFFHDIISKYFVVRFSKGIWLFHFSSGVQLTRAFSSVSVHRAHSLCSTDRHASLGVSVVLSFPVSVLCSVTLESAPVVATCECVMWTRPVLSSPAQLPRTQAHGFFCGAGLLTGPSSSVFPKAPAISQCARSRAAPVVICASSQVAGFICSRTHLFIVLLVRGIREALLRRHSSDNSVFLSAFFAIQLSHRAWELSSTRS